MIFEIHHIAGPLQPGLRYGHNLFGERGETERLANEPALSPLLRVDERVEVLFNMLLRSRLLS